MSRFELYIVDLGLAGTPELDILAPRIRSNFPKEIHVSLFRYNLGSDIGLMSASNAASEVEALSREANSTLSVGNFRILLLFPSVKTALDVAQYLKIEPFILIAGPRENGRRTFVEVARKGNQLTWMPIERSLYYDDILIRGIERFARGVLFDAGFLLTRSFDAEMWIDPGDADKADIVELYESLAELNRAVGGYGIDFKEDGNEVLQLEEACDD